MNISIWHQSMTDVTAGELAKALGKKLPNDTVEAHPTWRGRKYDVLIGWGQREPKDYAVGNTDTTNCKLVLNRLANVRLAADKLRALEAMRNAGVRVPVFTPSGSVKTAISNGTLKYPLIGRTKNHQGGSGMWECKMMVEVNDALAAGAEYFVQFVPNTDEYRIHVFNGEVLQVTKKTKQDNPASAFKAIKKEQFARDAAKEGLSLDTRTQDFVLNHLLKRDIRLPVQSERHNDRGWKFTLVGTNTVSQDLRTQAINAVNALGLNFGAVDCVVGEDTRGYIIEVNTAPSLRETMLEKYVGAFVDVINKKFASNTTTAKPTLSKSKTTTKKSAQAGSKLQISDSRRKALKDAFDIDDNTLDTLARVFGSVGTKTAE